MPGPDLERQPALVHAGRNGADGHGDGHTDGRDGHEREVPATPSETGARGVRR